MNEIEVKFKERENRDFFNEAYSSSNVAEYCLLDEKYEAIHPQVRCKDYFQDLFWLDNQIFDNKEEREKAINSKEDVYGFVPINYLTEYSLKNKDVYRVGIRFRTKGQDFRQFELTRQELAQSLMGQIETSLEFPTSNIFIDKSKEIMVFEFSNNWVQKPYLLSFYLLLSRMLSTIPEEELSKIEDFVNYLLEYSKKNSNTSASILKNSAFLLNKMFIEKELPEQTWESYKSMNSLHDASGVASYSMLLKRTEELSKSQKSTMSTNGLEIYGASISYSDN